MGCVQYKYRICDNEIASAYLSLNEIIPELSLMKGVSVGSPPVLLGPTLQKYCMPALLVLGKGVGFPVCFSAAIKIALYCIFAAVVMRSKMTD